jgi:hypothetical protein
MGSVRWKPFLQKIQILSFCRCKEPDYQCPDAGKKCRELNTTMFLVPTESRDPILPALRRKKPPMPLPLTFCCPPGGAEEEEKTAENKKKKEDEVEKEEEDVFVPCPDGTKVNHRQ